MADRPRQIQILHEMRRRRYPQGIQSAQVLKTPLTHFRAVGFTARNLDLDKI